jgi:predicted ATPase
MAGSGPAFPGTFEHYVASTILAWQKDNSCRNDDLTADLQSINLARDVFAHRVNDVAIEIYVQLVEGRSDNIADVGVGVSQVLPVLVALRAAEPGRLVYLEEPEINLHPRAQTRLADILAGAAKRGVRVVAETHSSLLLRAVQTLVAKGDLDPDLVRLHWFTRDAAGVSQVSSTKLDANGAFGDWPEDFDDVALDSEQQYLDAVEDRIIR